MKIILVDDDKDLNEALTQAYELADLEVIAYRNPLKALEAIYDSMDGIIVTDVRMPQMDGIDFFKKVQNIDPDIPVIVMTGHADVPMVLSALKDGVFDFLAKPIVTQELIATTKKAIETRRLVLENRQLRELANTATQETMLLGESAAIVRLREMIIQIAQADVDVLIEGESGSGKKKVAHLIHKLSNRSRHKFVDINCASLPNDVIKEELFGIDGATHSQYRRKKVGKIETSDRGTLFVNNIESASDELQGALLHVIENHNITPLGASESRYVDLRMIASTREDLDVQIRANTFRSDLYFRLNTVCLKVPPLRERHEDIPLLFAHFLEESSKKFKRKIPSIKPAARRHLYEHDWPGNVQELKNYAQTIVLGLNGPQETVKSNPLTLPQRVENFEASVIRSALKQSSGKVVSTLEILGIPRKTFYDKVTRHKIDLKEYR